MKKDLKEIINELESDASSIKYLVENGYIYLLLFNYKKNMEPFVLKFKFNKARNILLLNNGVLSLNESYHILFDNDFDLKLYVSNSNMLLCSYQFDINIWKENTEKLNKYKDKVLKRLSDIFNDITGNDIKPELRVTNEEIILIKGLIN